jgi:hypothetical protein
MRLDDSNLNEGVHPCKKVYVRCQGLKRRDKKIKNHNFIVGFYHPNALMKDCELDAVATIKEEMKTLTNRNCEISIQNYTIEIKDNMRIEKFSSNDIFDAEKKVVEVMF